MIKVPIGTPVDNTLAYLLDRDMMPVGKGKVVITINIFILNITTIFITTIFIITIIITTVNISLIIRPR